MNETLNTSYYLLLKQQIVLFEAMVVKAAITVDGQSIELEQLRKAIKNNIERIGFDITPPIILLEGKNIPLDAHQFIDEVGMTLERAINDEVDLNADHTKVNDLIYRYPELHRFEEKMVSTTPVQIPRELVIRLMDLSQRLLTTVNDWVGARRYEGRGSFQDMLVLVNFVEMIDYLFEYTNEKFGV